MFHHPTWADHQELDQACAALSLRIADKGLGLGDGEDRGGHQFPGQCQITIPGHEPLGLYRECTGEELRIGRESMLVDDVRRIFADLLAGSATWRTVAR